MREDTTLVSAKCTEATLETGLQEQGGKLDLRGEISSLPCCVFLCLLVLQINERKYNASIGEGHRSDLRDRATGTGGASWTSRVKFRACRAASSFAFSSFKLMREDTTLVSAKGTEATLETGLQEQGGQVGPQG